MPLSTLFFDLKLLTNFSLSKSPAAAVQSVGWTVGQQPCCSTTEAVLLSEMRSSHLGQGNTAVSRFFFFFASEGSSLGEPVLFPSQPLGCLHLGQCCFWLEEAKIYDAHFTLGILGLWSQELIWFVSLQVLKWGQVTYLSDVFKGESSLLCQPHSALCVLALVQARAVCGVGCLHFDSKLYRS